MTKTIDIMDLYPDKAQYRPGEKGNLVLEIKMDMEATCTIISTFKKLHDTAWVSRLEFHAISSGKQKILIPFEAPNVEWDCYGADVILEIAGIQAGRISTAFDVADHWRRAPRYGFLSDFKKEEMGELEDVACLNKFHLNIIQFYDWMYRHDALIPPEDEFIDPMGRSLSYQVVKEKIAALHSKGMAAMAYGAVYAALKDFLEQHPDWGLYKRTGGPFHLIDIFYIMDISPESPWSNHIVDEFRKVIEAGFDGIHMDQYGFPKKAIRSVDGCKEIVDLAVCYPALINQTKRELIKVNPEVGLIFNNVSNYPVHTTAIANQDAVYIEVWPPVIHLKELKGLIDRGRELSGDKQLILSAYLPTFHPESGVYAEEAENGALLTMATIFASGGYHLLLGEVNNVLTKAYYPNYGSMRSSFIKEVRRYYDFIVRYGKLLYDHALLDISMTHTGGINDEIKFRGDVPFEPNGDLNTVWTIIKQTSKYQVMHLVNLVGIDNDFWEHGKKQRPIIQTDIECTMLAEKEVLGVYFASPDSQIIEPTSIPFEHVEHGNGIGVRFSIPEVKNWSVVYVEFGEEQGK